MELSNEQLIELLKNPEFLKALKSFESPRTLSKKKEKKPPSPSHITKLTTECSLCGYSSTKFGLSLFDDSAPNGAYITKDWAESPSSFDPSLPIKALSVVSHTCAECFPRFMLWPKGEIIQKLIKSKLLEEQKKMGYVSYSNLDGYSEALKQDKISQKFDKSSGVGSEEKEDEPEEP